MPGAMSGGLGRGPRARAASTARANSDATGAGMLASQARWTSTIRTDSVARFSRSFLDRFVIMPRSPGAGMAPGRPIVRPLAR